MTLKTDTDALCKIADEFDRVADELKGQIAHMESAAYSLESVMQGECGTATQQAFARYVEAAQQEIEELYDISQQLHAACQMYGSTDHAAAETLSSEMNI